MNERTTVNSEIFLMVLFSRNFAYVRSFVKIKPSFTKWRNHAVDYYCSIWVSLVQVANFKLHKYVFTPYLQIKNLVKISKFTVYKIYRVCVL